MNGRVSFVLMTIAVLAFACTRSRTIESSSTNKSAHKKGTAVASALDVRVDDGVHFQLHVMNDGDRKVELNFENGMTHDIAVLDERGRQVWRWSDGRLFTAAYQNKVLRTHDTLSFNESWKDPAPGRYVAVARLVSQNFPQEQRVAFAVR
ncbi:MAG: hypothetical protein H3C62_11700 [Gemmatimonadaceae bacterium]|nr:hypothetical protein [Gemmatimonadaceae bacterium]